MMTSVFGKYTQPARFEVVPSSSEIMKSPCSKKNSGFMVDRTISASLFNDTVRANCKMPFIAYKDAQLYA